MSKLTAHDFSQHLPNSKGVCFSSRNEDVIRGLQKIISGISDGSILAQKISVFGETELEDFTKTVVTLTLVEREAAE